MSKKEQTTPAKVVETPVEEKSYSGLAVQKTNVKMHKLTHVMKQVKLYKTENPDITVDELTKKLYPNWEELTMEQFENKEWYVEEMLLPLLTQNSNDVYQKALEEEQAKLLSIDDAKKEFSW